MANFSTMADYEAYEKMYGHPGHPLPEAIRMAYVAEGRAIPKVIQNLSIILPPFAEQQLCCHAGSYPDCLGVTEKNQNVRAYAVAGFEYALGPNGEPMRELVVHCANCIKRDACSRDSVTPGSGWLTSMVAGEAGLVGAAGWCEEIPTEMTLGISLFPGARYLGKFLKWGLAASGVYMLGNAVLTSQGQMFADAQGPLANLLAPAADTTSGHGMNGGHVDVRTTTPATANADASGGTQLIYWALTSTPQAFTASNALPSIATAATIANVNAVGSGTAASARLIEAGDTAWGLSTTLRRYQMTVGAGSGEVSFNTTVVSSGGACTLTLTVQHGA